MEVVSVQAVLIHVSLSYLLRERFDFFLTAVSVFFVRGFFFVASCACLFLSFVRAAFKLFFVS